MLAWARVPGSGRKCRPHGGAIGMQRKGRRVLEVSALVRVVRSKALNSCMVVPDLAPMIGNRSCLVCAHYRSVDSKFGVASTIGKARQTPSLFNSTLTPNSQGG